MTRSNFFQFGFVVLGCALASVLGELVLLRFVELSPVAVALSSPLIFALFLVPSIRRLFFKPLLRRHEEVRTELANSQKMLVTVLDGLEAIVYVADIQTYEVLFMNAYARRMIGDATGKICWESIQQGQSGPCEFCSNKFLVDEAGAPKGVYAWEFQNTLNSRWYDIRDRAIEWVDGRLVRVEVATDVTDRKERDSERERLFSKLDAASAQVEKLEGFLPICSACKKIRDDEGYWSQIEEYVGEHTQAVFTHSLCPDCIERLYPEDSDSGN